MLSRRELFRVASLGGALVVTPGLLAACSDGHKPKADGPVTEGGITLVSSHVARSAADPSAVAGAASAMQSLGGALFGRLSGQGGNLALSPYSVAVALGMTVNGAAGKTRDEMLSVLHSADVDSLDAGDNALTQYVESLAGPVPHVKGQEIALDAANQLFGQHGVSWHKEFLDALAASFGAGLREVDYVKDAEGARKAINGWTAGQTHDRIPEIIPAGFLDALTRLVLVNTLYFKAPWSTPFKKGITLDGDFHLADGTTASVPMMHDPAARAVLGSGDGWQSARLAYGGEKLAMTLVLPDDGRLADVESLLASRPGDLIAADTLGAVDITLPRWKFTTAAALKEPLAAIGMPTAFGDGADFSGMTSDAHLFIKDVLHQVFIAVDEDGTEAAAATAVGMEATSAQIATKVLTFDRPFLFVIHDVENGTPLFLGRVADPRG